MTYSVIITAYKEPDLVPKAIESIILSNVEIIDNTQLIVVCGDELTYLSALETFTKHNFKNFLVLKDKAEGKSQALNLAFKNATGDVWVMTDGDIYLSVDATQQLVKPFNNVSVLGATGHIRSLDSKSDFFGYYSHLFCTAANTFRAQKQKNNDFFPLSGYLYAIRHNRALKLPSNLRAEDDYISRLTFKNNSKFVYVKDAVVNVHFPKNLKDLIRQKTRSLGGNVQNQKYFTTNTRSIFQDIKMAFFPLSYARNIKEFFYSLLIYPLRFYLWLVIYYNHMSNNYKNGIWERIDSSKY